MYTRQKMKPITISNIVANNCNETDVKFVITIIENYSDNR